MKIHSLALALIAFSINTQAGEVEIQLYEIADTYMGALLEYAQPATYFYNLSTDRHDKFLVNSSVGRRAFERAEDDALRALANIDPTTLALGRERVFYAKIVEALEASVGIRICRRELWNINHIDSPHGLLDILVTVQPIETAQNRSDAIDRWKTVADFYHLEIGNLRRGLKHGYSVPKRVVQRYLDQLQQLIEIELKQHPYLQLASNSGDADFQAELETVLGDEVLPAIREYAKFLDTEYYPQARNNLGISSIPNGRECYQALYRASTTLNRTPEQVHEIGRQAVARNKAEVIHLGEALYGVSNFAEIVNRTSADERQQFQSGQELHEYFEEVVNHSRNVMPSVFSTVPVIALTVESIPEYQRGSGRPAHYMPGSSVRDAKFMYDPTSFRDENFGTAEVVAVHEGYPGHHMQIALTQTAKPFHPIERFFSNDAYTEGWARYAERLAEEAGIYQSDAAKILRRAWPARGMVADTALHVIGWSEEEIVEFVRESGHSVTNDAAALLDRMAANPAQLTAYDSGALEIFALRRQFEDATGTSFDIRHFHDLVLAHGNVPLTVLRSQVERETTK